ncbi:MAG: trehalase family glycosidase [Leptolyngbyaceae bacterium]|nr:trehalase family glycosidase [Leptolyngbyaceae bacterium]
MTSALISNGDSLHFPARVRLSDQETALLHKAQAVLNDHWLGHATQPAPQLYPYQWSWDSGFIAMGYAHYDQERAMQELRSLFQGQWKNGLLPHIVFHNWDENGRAYCPGPDDWQVERSPYAPRHVPTSGIIQPPIHATAALHIYRHARDQKRAYDFLIELFPQLVAWHHYLYRERNLEQDGLIYIRHPWESGQDNSPLWDSLMQRMLLAPHRMPASTHGHTRLVRKDARSQDDDLYLYLLNRAGDCAYDEALIQRDCPFLVQDVLFNALLVKANQDLAAIATLLGFDAKPFDRWAQQTARSINIKLWNPFEGFYMSYDLVAEAQIPVCVASNFTPLYAQIPNPEQASEMVSHLFSSAFQGNSLGKWAVPSCSRQEMGFSAYLYWRGPIWMNLNWLLYHGLFANGFVAEAHHLRQLTLRLFNRSGFCEYFHPDSGEGLGTPNYSWSAALAIDLILGSPSLGASGSNDPM